ncbi:MAG: hypothetical protein A3G32_08515 [Deltaproteobacteria bacterium RIFCSPLOWO2_12_FULL_40_28]|nr:MAG: hypothetical protein A3C45_01215 [Deltaproteobacteria bacterium RIFCSPHIGHO2_02_FULL_40_28]OGQ20946.1 MAG: hypothetical protein A3E27_03880 [Deltaproteobacteria bacterium RIFCSPHIGHO2_12_FULL_40_32]OGQ39347.1 MAG: hypothetical protein A3I69_05240 [Deltaproteobacteria bacterium RIFCSPLOWO2_02_FULL_40_36]OGQ54628.1 MAG: hypothetical protein A3G32_08515 [Deltaproteobacteria bacterium RIFCSPLOWO2_12_FULL_40_28]
MKSFIFILLVVFSFVSQTVAAAPCATPAKTLKLATLAPEGTGMYKGLVAVQTKIKAQTQGCVDVQLYGGGSAGDEKDVVRKMRIGQLHGAALTGVGLGQIEPEIRVLELPFLFKDYAKVDSTYGQLKPYFEQKLNEKGFQLLGWAEVGFVQIFSNKPIKSRADLSGMKMWMWEGDALAQAMYESLKVVPVPLAVTDVLTSLQTGLIDGCYAPPLGAIAFQWPTKTKFVTKVDLVMGTGALILANSVWQTLAPAEQTIVKAVISEEAKGMVAQSRTDNQQSMTALQSMGLQIVTLTPEAQTELESISKEVATKLVGKLYPQPILDKTLALAGPR